MKSTEEKIIRIKDLISRLDNDQNVSLRDLKNILSTEQLKAFDEKWSEQKSLRLEVKAKNKPSEIVEYEARLKKAILLYNKAEGSARGEKGKSQRGNAYLQSEAECERLREYLEDILQANRSLEIWFDRTIGFDAGGETGLTPEEMPRVVTSRSSNRRGIGILAGIRGKRDLKIEALSEALSEAQFQENRANSLSNSGKTQSDQTLPGRDLLKFLRRRSP